MPVECYTCKSVLQDYEFGLDGGGELDETCLACRAKEPEDTDINPQSYRIWAMDNPHAVPNITEKAMRASYPKYTILRLLLDECKKENPEGVDLYHEYCEAQKMSPEERKAREQSYKQNQQRKDRRANLKKNNPKEYKALLRREYKSKERGGR